MPQRETAEHRRLIEDHERRKHWRRWGPYLAERSWGTVREDYSASGAAWEYLPHDHARSRAYRWGEDGILGISDNHQRLCFALAFWNGKDSILKERLFGLTGPEGNHGEDVKEIYYYLDATPTNSYLKGLYKYPQAKFPYDDLVAESRRRSRLEPEFELEDTGVFNDNRYFDIFAEYAKHDVDDIFIRVTIANRGPEEASLLFLPTLWFRNTWSWHDHDEPERPSIARVDDCSVHARHQTLGDFTLDFAGSTELLFTENETNTRRLYNWQGDDLFFKDAFHRYLIANEKSAINTEERGTKIGIVYRLTLSAGEEKEFLFRLHRPDQPRIERKTWPQIFQTRIDEASDFYAQSAVHLPAEAANVQRQAFAGMFWSRQYYHFVIDTWLKGDPGMPAPPPERKHGRNHTWRHLFNDDLITMPDKWEYPWYAAWDSAFHMIAIAPVDPDAAKDQLRLFLREWYMHPNGQIPAYEWNFNDVNPPVHAWACWRVFQIDRRVHGKEDHAFLESAFHKLLMNFTWWVNRKDSRGANIFEGGFLGLDNIGVFDRNRPLPDGWLLEQSDGTSWMAMFCQTMMKIALHLANRNPTYEDIASKFFEHFLYIASAINHSRGTGLWDEDDGFYYDRLRRRTGPDVMLRLRSLVGLTPLFASDTIELDYLDRHPGFKRRMQWFIDNRPDLTGGIASLSESGKEHRRLLSVTSRPRLERVLSRLFDESEFLSPYGIRSMSQAHRAEPYLLDLPQAKFRVTYEPAESCTDTFGGNSNWRGPVWFPMNYLLIEALQRLDHYYGDSLTVAFPTGSSTRIPLREAAKRLSQRLSALFLRSEGGKRPADGESVLYRGTHFRDHVLFYEYFDGDTGKGLGASHQTGWTGLVAKLLQQSGTPDIWRDVWRS